MDAEKALYAAVRKAAGKVSEDKRAGKFRGAGRDAGIAESGGPVFCGIMVMAEDEAVRKTAGAAGGVAAGGHPIVDFSDLAGVRADNVSAVAFTVHR